MVIDKLSLIIGILVLTACGVRASPQTMTPEAIAGPEEVEAIASPTPPQTAPATVNETTSPATNTPLPETSLPPATVASLPVSPVQPLQSWSVAADDGAVFVLDTTNSLYQLAPTDLTPLTKSSPLFEAAVDTSSPYPFSTYLLAGQTYLFVGSEAISQTLVLNRTDFSRVTTLNQAGPLALDPGRWLLLAPHSPELPLYTAVIWAYDLADLSQPPQEIQQSCTFVRNLAAEPQARRLYLHGRSNCSSPPHQREFYTIYDLDTLTELGQSQLELGTLTRPAMAPQAGLIVTTLAAKSGFFSASKLAILDRQGQELKAHQPLDGIPAIDANGDWLYLLRSRGLWVLRGSDLFLQSILFFAERPPADLVLSPDGQTLYLFGNGWLEVLPTAELQTLGIPSLSPFPVIWNETDPNAPSVSRTRFYRSPTADEDGIDFIQVGQYWDYGSDTQETYRTIDGGQTWHFLTALTYPTYQNVQQLSLSPDFATDQTLTAHSGTALLRSTDRGDTWLAWSPPLAFVSERDGNRELYLMDQTGSGQQRLTDSPTAEENPAWSPTWTRLAFQSDRNGNWDIFTMRTDCNLPVPLTLGGACDLRQLTTDPADDLLPAWSPDGRSIAFVSMRDGNPEIYLMDGDGQNQRRLTFNPTGDWRPAWLPDSRQILFTSDRSGNNDIYRLAVPPLAAAPLTSEPELTPVVADPADDRDPAISGNSLFFLSDREGVMRTYRLDLKDPYGQPRPATETDQPEGHPSPVSDSPYTVLVATEREGVSNVYRVIGSDYTPLTSSPAFDGQPTWGPVLWDSREVVPEEDL